MKYYDTKIGQIVEKEFDTRVENAVFALIMEKGIEYFKELKDEDISSLKGNALMTEGFVQAMYKCAKRICCECEWIEMIQYIRLHLWCTPTVHEVTLYREDFTEDSFAELLNELDLDDEDVLDSVKLYAVVEEE